MDCAVLACRPNKKTTGVTMNPGQRRPHLPALALLLPALLFGGEAAAERPMVVDDAGALTRGDGKVEFGWSRAGRTRGFDLAAGYVPVDDVEISLGLARTHDHAARRSACCSAGSSTAVP